MLAIHVAQRLNETTPRQGSRDKHLFNTLVNEHSSYLFRYGYWRCQNRALAEDLVQETFLRAWKNLDKLQDLGAAKAWLTTILRREHARLFERARVHIDPEALPDAQPAVREHDTSAEAFALREALSRLPETYREPLLLQVLGGFNMQEIAAQLGISKSAAMTRLFRAKQKMRHALVREHETA
jgi:RNA polymerase sigma-70 factor (ECF subfamily)